MATCEMCGKDTSRKKDTTFCHTCLVKRRDLIRKLRLIKLLGGCCQKCGWAGHPVGFVFHHTDPSSKEGEISKMIRTAKWGVVVQEVSKCQLLCATCHNIHHSNGDHEKILMFASAKSAMFSRDFEEMYLLWLASDTIAILQRNLAAAEEKRDYGRKRESICEECGTTFEKQPATMGRFCSRRCSVKHQHETSKNLPPLTKECQMCHSTFETKDDLHGRKRKFCSCGCASKWANRCAGKSA